MKRTLNLFDDDVLSDVHVRGDRRLLWRRSAGWLPRLSEELLRVMHPF